MTFQRNSRSCHPQLPTNYGEVMQGDVLEQGQWKNN